MAPGVRKVYSERGSSGDRQRAGARLWGIPGWVQEAKARSWLQFRGDDGVCSAIARGYRNRWVQAPQYSHVVRPSVDYRPLMTSAKLPPFLAICMRGLHDVHTW